MKKFISGTHAHIKHQRKRPDRHTHKSREKHECSARKSSSTIHGH